jgi:hypothetical protein
MLRDTQLERVQTYSPKLFITAGDAAKDAADDDDEDVDDKVAAKAEEKK